MVLIRRAPEDIFKFVRSEWDKIPRDNGNILPHRTNLKPMELRGILPYIVLGKHIGGGELFYRLAGTQVVEFLGFNPVGKTSEDIPSLGRSQKSLQKAIVLSMLSHPCGVLTRRTLPHKTGDLWTYDTLSLPMIMDDNEADLILAASYITPLKGEDLVAKPGSFNACKMEVIKAEFIDIGAGIPKMPKLQ